LSPIFFFAAASAADDFDLGKLGYLTHLDISNQPSTFELGL